MAGRLGDGDGPLTVLTTGERRPPLAGAVGSTPHWLGWSWVVPTAFLLVFLAYPLGVLGSHVWSGEGIERLVSWSTWRIVPLAVLQATISTVLAVAVGLPIANSVSRYAFRGRALAQALVTVPFVLPTVVVALAFRSLLGPGIRQGFVLVVLAHAYVNLAVVVRIVGAQWAQQDGRLESVARTLGATRLSTFRTVTLPTLRPAIASSSAVVFVFSFTSLGIVLLLGDSSTRTLESQILRQTSVLLDFPGATASAVIQLVLVSGILLAGAMASRNPARRRMRPIDRSMVAATRSGRWAVMLTSAFSCVIVILPIAALVIASVRVSGRWSLAWWTGIGSIDAGTSRIGSPLSALWTSLAFALICALVACVVGGLAAVAVLTHGRTRVISLLAIVPLGISSATLGLGTLLAFGRAPMDLRGTGLLVPIAHSLVAVPLVVAVVAPALRGTDGRLMAVAASLGARPSRAFLTAYGPVLRVVMLASAGLACAVSLGEFGAASFLARAGSPTVPVQIVRLLGRPGEQSYGAAAVLAVILVALTLTLVLAVDRLSAPRSRRTVA